MSGGVPATASARPAPGDVATIQYSSGSTGVPKGILLGQGAMLRNIRDVRDGLGLRSDDVSVNWIPLYHDMGLIDAFLLPLLCGCPTVLIPTMDFLRDPGQDHLYAEDNDMPGYAEDLSEEELEALVVFLRGLAPGNAAE